MEKLKEYLVEELTAEELKEMVIEVNSYNGNLDWLDYQENDDDFFENYFQTKQEVARAIHYGDYNYMDDYVRFNVYGNLESCSEYELETELESYKEEIIEAYLEVYEEDTNYFRCDKCYQIIEQYKEEHETQD